jgi:hypothetical protein
VSGSKFNEVQRLKDAEEGSETSKVSLGLEVASPTSELLRSAELSRGASSVSPNHRLN